VNNVMGIGLFLDPDDNENSGKPFGQILLPPLYLDPNPHSHTTSSLSHGTPSVSGTGHTHDMTHTHTASGSVGSHSHDLAEHVHNLADHVHSLENHRHSYYAYEPQADNANTGVPSSANTGAASGNTLAPVPNTSDANTATATVTVDEYSDETQFVECSGATTIIADHAAGNTGDTDLDVALVSP